MTSSAVSNEGPATSAVKPRRFSNSWATVPLRIFLAALFLFASYAKLTYPGFFDPKASFGFHSAVQNAKDGNTPLSSLMGPLVDHSSLFGHVTAFAELAIGLGLLVGLLTRIAALGGIVLAASIVLSINWPEVKQYTGNGGWFTSVDLAVIAALSVFVLGGAGPLSLDGGISALRARRNARQDAAEPSFINREEDLEDSRRRLRGEPGQGWTQDPGQETRQGWTQDPEPARTPDEQTAQLPDLSASGRDHAPNQSLWNEPRPDENPR
jgi:thiosulfate dehydrogenase [quinone] large subunit